MVPPCCMVATDFLHPMEPQAFLPAGYPANYANYIADPVCDVSCLTISCCVHWSLNPEKARLELRGWEKMGGAIGTADTSILSWLA